MPAIGIGTFGSDKYSAEQVSNAVYGAVENGYRLIDCASVYQNEKEIGAVLGRLFDNKVVKREELFITGKVWNDMHGEGEVIASCKQSLADLGLPAARAVCVRAGAQDRAHRLLPHWFPLTPGA